MYKKCVNQNKAGERFEKLGTIRTVIRTDKEEKRNKDCSCTICLP